MSAALRVIDSDDGDDAMLIIEACHKTIETLLYFTSPISDHIARMNILDHTIVVEHDVYDVETATFEPGQRREAINFIQCLFKVFRND